MDLKNKRILVTGGVGFLGSFVVEQLEKLSARVVVFRSRDFDLTKQERCARVFRYEYDIVIHLAGRVGGIGLNKAKPAELFYNNILMGINVLEASLFANVKKFVLIGTVCSYPKNTPIPFKEEDLWNGYPEETNAPYGLSKKMMLVQGQAYRAQYGWNSIHLLSVNLYGPRDHFDPERSHVIPALIRKVDEAKKAGKDHIEVWGTGKATREFLYVDDAAEGITLAAERYDGGEPVNLGSGMEISVKDLTEMICRLMDFRGEIKWDSSKPDGQPKRRLDVSRAEKYFGFKAKVSFEEGLRRTIDWYLKSKK